MPFTWLCLCCEVSVLTWVCLMSLWMELYCLCDRFLTVEECWGISAIGLVALINTRVLWERIKACMNTEQEQTGAHVVCYLTHGHFMIVLVLRKTTCSSSGSSLSCYINLLMGLTLIKTQKSWSICECVRRCVALALQNDPKGVVHPKMKIWVSFFIRFGEM